MGLKTNSFVPTTFHVKDETSLRAAVNTISMALKPGEKPIVIGLAADSGCGKSTFMRRVTALFGGKFSFMSSHLSYSQHSPVCELNFSITGIRIMDTY